MMATSTLPVPLQMPIRTQMTLIIKIYLLSLRHLNMHSLLTTLLSSATHK